ncbi:TPA: hypothetical protein ACWW8Y_004952 [Escherichia coli]
MNTICARLPSADTLAEQAAKTASGWMSDAVIAIDELFGKGYAKQHPELVAAFMQTAGLDEAAMHLRGLVLANQRIDDTLEVLSEHIMLLNEPQ